MHTNPVLRAVRAASFALLVSATSFAASSARANTPEDLQGLSARTNAMGGAGTALGGDFSSAYYNPAGLTRCRSSHVALDMRHSMASFGFDRRGPNAPVEDPAPTHAQTRVTIGACLKLPFNLAAGFSLGLGLQNQLTLDQSTANPQPKYVMYGDTLENLSVALGVAYRPIPEIAIGAGVGILAHLGIGIGARVPIAMQTPGAPGTLEALRFDLHIDMTPAVAPYVGALVAPIERLRFGLTYRAPLFFQLHTPVNIQIDLVGLSIPIPLQLNAIGWYSPRQLALGVAGEVVPSLTLSADVTWYQWSALGGTSYPFLDVTPTDNAQGATSQIGFTDVKNPGWKDVWAVRLGGELRLARDRLALRGGYTFRTSGVALPNRSNVNLLDGAIHAVSFGGGWFFGERSRAPGATALSVNGSVDVYARASFMPQQLVAAKDYAFGGNAYDLGAMFSLGWY